MVDLTVSVITLTLYILNTPKQNKTAALTKTRVNCQTELKNKTQLYGIYKRYTLNIKTQMA